MATIICGRRELPGFLRGAGTVHKWCLLGRSEEIASLVERARPRARRLRAGDALTEIASECKNDFIEWIASIGCQQNSRMAWWRSELASRDPLQCPLYERVCSVLLLHRWISSTTAPDLIIVEDPWVLAIAKRDFRDCDVRVVGSPLQPLVSEAASNVARLFLVRVVLLARALWGFVFATPPIARHRPEASVPVWLFSWVEQELIAAGGAFRDSSTGRLASILESKGTRVGRVLPVVIPHRRRRELRAYCGQAIPLERYVSLTTIGQAALSVFWITSLQRLSVFRQHDLALLLYAEVLREWGSSSSFMNRLWFASTRAMARRHLTRATFVVYPFENQPWEKMFCAAVRESAPGVTLIGYQHSSVADLQLRYTLAAGERDFCPVPDLIVANGPRALATLTKNGFGVVPIVNGGALRFEHLTGCNGGGPVEVVRPLRPRILAALSSSIPHAAWLVEVILKHLGSRETTERQSAEQGIDVILKFHPQVPIKKLGIRRDALPAHITVSDTPLSKLLSGASVLLYTPPTTSCWDAIACGVPALKVVGDMIDLEPDTGVDLRCSPDTLAAEIAKLLVGGSRSSQNRQHAFDVVNEEVWLRALNVGNAAALAEAR